MSARTVAAVVLGAGFLLSLTACGDSTTTSSAPTAAASTAAAPSAAASAAAPSAAASSAAGSSAAAGAGCPVTQEKLLDVVKSETDRKPPAGTRMTEIVCHDGWAIASYEPPNQESEGRTFQFKSGAWHNFVGGNAGYCEGVPADIQKYFNTNGHPCA